MPTQVNVHEAKTHLSKLLERVEAGEEFVIARAGKPIAVLSAVPKADETKPKRKPGFAKDLFPDGVVDALCDPEWDKEFEDLFYNGSVFPNESSDR